MAERGHVSFFNWLGRWSGQWIWSVLNRYKFFGIAEPTVTCMAGVDGLADGAASVFGLAHGSFFIGIAQFDKSYGSFYKPTSMDPHITNNATVIAAWSNSQHIIK